MGTVEGYTERVLDNHEVDVFLGIPFAKPPVNELRFASPERFSVPWTGVRNATYFRPSCVQEMTQEHVPGESSEDCLYLNVFAPKNLTGSAPVFLWIYGGSYRDGSSTLKWYNGAVLAATGRMIVVTINYRVGALGFLATPSKEASGNAGFEDQQMALTWVSENIDAFGGDKSMVTIAGTVSRGWVGQFASFGTRQPEFILESNCRKRHVTSLWAARTEEFANRVAEAMANETKCGTDWSTAVSCLRKKAVEEISAAQLAVYNSYRMRGVRTPFSPVVDGHVIPDEPIKMLQAGDFKKTQLLTGVNRDEFASFINNQILSPDGKLEVNRTMFGLVIGATMGEGIMAGIPPATKGMVDAAIYEYTDWTAPNSDSARLTGMIEYGTDTFFQCPLVLEATEWSKQDGAKLFMYQYTHEDGMWPPWMGVPHAAEFRYVFGVPFSIPTVDKVPFGNFSGKYTYTEADRQVSLQIMNLWSAFVKTG